MTKVKERPVLVAAAWVNENGLQVPYAKGYICKLEIDAVAFPFTFLLI